MLLAPFQKPREKYYEVGIGLNQYLKNHPESVETLIASEAFYSNVSDTFFK
ncbi:MAG: hypothetical protein K0B02_03255 [DPANN group archaeon]|nr:hypothetical protein [DPANN group archaeon]